MAESMEKPPPYAPPYDAAEHGEGKGEGYGAYPGSTPNFLPPGAYNPNAQNQQYPQQYPQQYTQYQGTAMGQNYPSYGSTVYVHQPPPQTQVIVVGGCPACRIGVLEDDFTGLGICLAVLCFPIGVLCCLAMRQRRCPNCGAIFG